MGYVVATLSVIYFQMVMLIIPYNVRNYRMARTRELDALACPHTEFSFTWCRFIQASPFVPSDFGSVPTVLAPHSILYVTSVGRLSSSS